MFQFSTTTLVNSFPSDTTSDEYKKVVALYKKDGSTSLGKNAAIHIAHGVTFRNADKDCINIYKAPYKAESFDTLVVTLSGLTTTNTYRLALYVRSVNNADPNYANDFVFKGRPYMIEFSGSKTVDQIASIIEKYQLNTRDLVQFEVKYNTSAGTLTLTATNGYQRIYYAVLQEWVDQTSTSNGYTEGYYKNLNVINFDDLSDTQVNALATSSTITGTAASGVASTLSLTRGFEGKGTYEQVLKDLRLPTGDNFAHLNVNQFEMPIVGGKYTQYTFEMKKDLTGYAGGIGINNPTQSITYHHVFVESGAVSAFETAVKAVLENTKFLQGVGDTTVEYTAADDDNNNNVISTSESE